MAKFRNKVTGEIVEAPDKQSLLGMDQSTLQKQVTKKFFGETTEEKLKEYESKEIISKNIREQEKLSKPVFEKIGQEHQNQIIGLQKIPGEIKVLRDLAKNIPEDPIKASLWKVGGNTIYAQPDQQKTLSALEFAILDITKNLQGARPSDVDTKRIENAINAIGKGRKTFEAALDIVQEIAEKNTRNYTRTLARGYNLDENTMNYIAGLDGYGNKVSTPEVKTATSEAKPLTADDILKKYKIK